MTSTTYKRFTAFVIAMAFFFVVVQLIWEYSQGGVVNHHLLARKDMPAISNGWGLIVMPILAWLAVKGLSQRVKHNDSETDEPTSIVIPKSAWFGFFGMLLYSAVQSTAFKLGLPQLTMYLAMGLLVVGLCLPIYRGECILGHVVGASWTFGPVIPLIGMAVLASISMLAHFLFKPFIAKCFRPKSN